MQRPAVVALLASLALPATALELSDRTEDYLFLLEDSIGTASKHLEPVKNAPAAVAVITADDLARFGDRTVAEAIARAVPGWYVVDSHETAFVGIRGYGGRGEWNSEILVLLNGLPLNERWSASSYLDQLLGIDVSLIDRIEILSGPTSVLYGTNAFFGTVAIITKTAEDVGRAAATADGIEDGSGRLAAMSAATHGDFSFVAAADAFASRGVSYDFPELGSSPRSADRDQSWAAYASARTGGFSFQAGYGRRDKSIPTAPYGSVFGTSRNRYPFRIGFADGRYEGRLSERLTYHAMLSLYSFRYDDDLIYNDDPESFPDGYRFHDTGTDTTVGGEFQIEAALSRRQHLVVGFDGGRSSTESISGIADPPGQPEIRIPVDLTAYALYAEDEIGLTESLRLSAGLRYDGNTRFQSSLSPRAALLWFPTEKDTVKLLVGKGFRNPSPYEAFFDDGYSILPNPDLSPQVLWSAEAMYEQRVASGYFVRAGAHVERGRDLFRQVEVNLGGIPCDDPDADCRVQIQNIGRMNGRGVELVFEADPGGVVRAYASAAWQKVEDPELPFDVFNSPRLILKAGLSYPLLDRRLFLAAGGSYLSRRITLDGTDLTVRPTEVLDLTAYAPRALPHLDLTLAVRNVLDRENPAPAVSEDISPLTSIPQEGRTLRLQATLRF